MKANTITSCYIGPQISPEQFVAEHFFLYLVKGSIDGYDGEKHAALQPGQYCIVRKNHLARYNKQLENGQFEKVVVIFDTAFLKTYKEKHKTTFSATDQKGAFLLLNKNKRVHEFIVSLAPYYKGHGKVDEPFSNLKREELLRILLPSNPGLANVLFDFGIPEKIDLEAFMNKNYKFNVSIERFAFLTGRSLSSFKRDFEKTFHATPSRWLIRKRLREAHFLIERKKKKPSDIYIGLGFENLSHFSFAFKNILGKQQQRWVVNSSMENTGFKISCCSAGSG